VIRGATDNYMDDIERAIDDGVNTFKGLTKVFVLVAFLIVLLSIEFYSFLKGWTFGSWCWGSRNGVVQANQRLRQDM
jgi:hypothetical protein